MTRGAEVLAIALLTLVVAAALQVYGFNDDLSEYDLYSHAVGLWDGHHAGSRLASPLHYSSWLNYGFIELAYLIGGERAFADRTSLAQLINTIGHISTAAIVPLGWLALRLAYGAAAAVAALCIFCLSPTFLDIAGAGHPVLTSLALFFAGAAALFTRAQGPARWALMAVAAAALSASLMVRMELVFAFPLLVLAQPGAGSPRTYLIRAAQALIPCLIAIAMFFVTRRLLLGDGSDQQAGAFFDQWYRLSNIPKGLIAAALAVGLGSWLAFAAALAFETPAVIRAGVSPQRWKPYGYLATGLAVIVVALAFWLPNPIPARHFVLTSLAVSVVIAVFIARRFRLTWPAMALVGLLVALANQAGAIAMGPVVARLSPSELAQPVGVLVPAPAGDALTRRAALKARARQVRELGADIVQARCHRDVVVISEQAPALVSAFFRPGASVAIALASYDAQSFAYIVQDGGQTTTLLQSLAPETILGRVVADPRFAGAGIYVDPLTRLATQPGDPPPGRAETLSCGS